jgi:hypothetical protein
VAVRFLSRLVIDASIVLSGWLFCCVGCFIWMLMRYNEFKLSMKMCAGSLGNSCVIICRVWCMADISARSMFCRPISLWGRFILCSGFQMPYPACVGSQKPLACCLGGINDPSV